VKRTGDILDEGAEAEALEPAAAPGRMPRTVQLARTLAQRAARQATRPTSVEDIATLAVESRGAGAAIDGGVAARVGAHLGQDFSGVRVHGDPLSREATQAMGARAFAYGGDVFLGPGESDTDLALMAHELTHVAQQGAAATRAPQRQVAVGAAGSPAEQQADQVAAQVAGGAAPWLADDDHPVPGATPKAAFLFDLRGQVIAACERQLGAAWTALGCPTIDRYFSQYRARSAQQIMAAVRRFAPATASATTAAAVMPALVARIEQGITAWAQTGEAPADLAGLDGDDAAPAPAATPPTAAALRAAGSDARAARAILGEGAPLDGGAAARIADAYGESFADVRVHTGPAAQRFAADQAAAAVTFGPHIAFAAGEYQPGTATGDALLAHELAHVVQQRGASAVGDSGHAHEEDADQAAAGAIVRMSPVGRSLGLGKLGPALRAGLSLQRCSQNRAQRAHDKLVHLSGINDAQFAAEVGAMSADETRELLDNVSAADRTAFAALLTRIRNERLVSTAEGLTGQLYWAGGSGPDPGDGYQIKQTTRRPTDDRSGAETNTNEFAAWIHGGAEPTNASKMNCWEAVLYSGYRAGVIPRAWIFDVHQRAAAAGSAASGGGTGPGVDAYYAVLRTALNFGSAVPYVHGTPPPRGNLVFMDELAHVALSRGGTDGAGNATVMSLWILPGASSGNFVSTFQQTTIEAINGSWTGLGRPAMNVKHAPNPWA
jgi:hypothetical protein